MSKPKILIIPARRHILESYCEYLIRYLGDEFYFEMGYPPEAYYYSIIREAAWYGNTSPLEKNPHDFDLIYPQFSTHPFIEPLEDFAHKLAIVALEPGQYSKYPEKVAVIGVAEEGCELDRPDAHKLRFGIDTELFQPFPQARLDDKLHIGFVGNILTPRRYMKELFIPLAELEGVKIDIYPTSWLKHTRTDEIENMGGQVLLDNIVGGDMWLSGLPNIYNRMDILVRSDIDYGYHFPVLEAAACGVPVVAVGSGLVKDLAEAGGAIAISAGDRSWSPENLTQIAKDIQEAVIKLRDNPKLRKEMGAKGRKFILENYTWDKWISAWREFFKEGVTNARKN